MGALLQAEEFPGDALIVTTLAGDLYVFALGATAILHAWAPGSLGAYNSIPIDDLDDDGKNELYVAGSQGIWKWKQK